MKNPFVARFVSVLRWLKPSFHKQAEPLLSPEQFRKMLEEAISEPETRQLLLRSFVTLFPIQGGACINAPDVSAVAEQYFGSGTNCTQGDYYFPAKVGIGTTEPVAKLHILESGNNTTGLRVIQNNTTASNGLVVQTQTSEAGDIALGVYSNAGATMGLMVRNNGKVGIGTASPATDLELSRTTNAELRVSAVDEGNDRSATLSLRGSGNGGALTGGAIIDFTDSDPNPPSGTPGALQFKKAGSTYLTLLNGGNVGIGTTNPGTLLHVQPAAADANKAVTIQETSYTPFGGWDASLVRIGENVNYPGTSAPDSASEFGLNVEVIANPPTHSSVSYEKGAIIAFARIDEESDYTQGSAKTRDIVGADVRGLIGTTNNKGRAWGLAAEATILHEGTQHGDGVLYGAEIAVENWGSNESQITGQTEKVGVLIVSRKGRDPDRNANPSTAALCIVGEEPAVWHKGIYCLQSSIGNGTDDAFIQLKDNSSPQNILFQVDRNGVIDMYEQSSTPAAPSADKARIFARDNGSGKTQLCVLFNTGAVQVIATQP